jgi:hypothetical protein
MQESLDSIPVIGVFVVFAIVSLIVYEIGYQIGRWWQRRTPEEIEGPTGMIVGSLLALMAFLLAITMGMAADRFDTRRGIVLEEANSIGTTYLRAGYLPEPASSTTRELLREYVPLRIIPDGAEDVPARIARSAEILDELWLIAETLAIASPESVTLGLYIETLNETIDVNETRIIAGLFARVPESVVFLLIIGSVLTLGMVGYGAGLTRRRSPLTAVAMIVVLGAVITLVVDLDRPGDGFVSVSQQALTDLENQIGPPS